jgi:hypothetical protein
MLCNVELVSHGLVLVRLVEVLLRLYVSTDSDGLNRKKNKKWKT